MNNQIRKNFAIAFVLLVLLVVTTPVHAQNYSFSVDRQIVHAFWENDGTLSLFYEFYFTNFGDPMDFIDVGLPTPYFNTYAASAEVNGKPINDISISPYVENGIALGLGSNAIPSGQSGTVLFQIRGIQNVLYQDSDDSEYTSAVFSPTWFGSEFVSGSTDLTVIYHFPAEVNPEEPRWHQAPSGFPSEPLTGFDEQGRITYTWRNDSANMSRQYIFGASFPATYVPATTVATPSFWQNLGVDPEAIFGWLCICGVGFFFLAIPILTIRNAQKRKLQYLPPKLAIEGHGIKRGLTAIEASILLEQPMDKILTMILFAVIKKGAAKVISRDPLTLEITDPLPPELREYEKQFLAAMEQSGAAKRKQDLQTAMVNLVKSVSRSMKGFSQRESRNYYKKIIDAAWQQVESSDTPEVKSETYDKVMEWTMLDNEYDEKTKRVFQGYPVFLPTWWHHYNPQPFGTSSTPGKIGAPISRPTSGGTKMPTLPGSDFAGSIVTGVQDFSAGVIGGLSAFTSGVTNKTNPIPKTTSSGGSFRSGGGSSCACACACAGCACACAGGGR